MSNVNDVLAAITAANEAYAKVPELEAEINLLRQRLSEAQSINTQYAETLDNANARIVSLNQTTSTLEAERDALGFRAKASDDKLAQVLAVLGVAVPPVVEAKPEPQPEPEPVHDLPAEPSASPTLDPAPHTSKPYAGMTYYERPHNVGYSTFELGGGESWTEYQDRRFREEMVKPTYTNPGHNPDYLHTTPTDGIGG